jgi:hypothetical protein
MCVIETHHVIRKSNHALPRKTNAPAGNAPVPSIRHATFIPMAMRVENRRKRAHSFAGWPIQVAGKVKTGKCFKVDLLDRVAVTLNSPEDMRI